MPKTIEVSDETYERIKDQLTSKEVPANIGAVDDMVGHPYFFRTMTYHMLGAVTGWFTAKDSMFVCLENASWIPDSGRFMQFIRDGVLNEVEPVGRCMVNLSTVTDIFPWKHPLPKDQK
jgi:hypothetical protein